MQQVMDYSLNDNFFDFDFACDYEIKEVKPAKSFGSGIQRNVSLKLSTENIKSTLLHDYSDVTPLSSTTVFLDIDSFLNIEKTPNAQPPVQTFVREEVLTKDEPMRGSEAFWNEEDNAILDWSGSEPSSSPSDGYSSEYSTPNVAVEEFEMVDTNEQQVIEKHLPGVTNGRRFTQLSQQEFTKGMYFFFCACLHDLKVRFTEQLSRYMLSVMNKKWSEVQLIISSENQRLRSLFQTHLMDEVILRCENDIRITLMNVLVEVRSNYNNIVKKNGSLVDVLNSLRPVSPFTVKTSLSPTNLDLTGPDGVTKRTKKGRKTKANKSPRSTNSASRTLPFSATMILQEWYDAHSDDPYPRSEDKKNLIQATKLTLKQINNWFVNHRCRDKTRVKENRDTM
ncbi:hypothetical protein AKO1_014053 [Acrasis kona]|uniref:Homeobox domain-containing protein n=1 Tax=Acrasis kona TaxID=1008807 RepID=A0AAW2Z3Y8_9EUKA